MTGHPVTYDEACLLPWTDVLMRWQELEQRDAMARSIAALQARGARNADRSLDPADYPPLSVAEHLELLALGEAAARRLRHPAAVHHAVLAGATWEQIADAAGSDPQQARERYLRWAEGQRDLREQFPGGTIGLSADEYDAAVKAARGGPDPDRPETWAFGEAPVQPLRPDEVGGYVCPETSDGQHCGDWHEGGKCGACGQTGPDPDEDQADEPEPAPYDPGPEIDDEGGMSEYRYLLPEDYERGQS